MGDELKNLMMSRAVGAGVTPPPNPSNKVPPAWKRWETAQEMAEGYRNNWNPNPVLLGIMK